MLNAIDRLWQEHLYAMDALRDAVGLRAYGQKDPLIEYKTEAYDMFVELMANIKNEVVDNLFKSTTNLMAFEKFLRTCRRTCCGRSSRSRRERPGDGQPMRRTQMKGCAGEENRASRCARKGSPKAGRNDPCPCGSGKKYKNCCGRMA